jgi:hypothetical protein
MRKYLALGAIVLAGLAGSTGSAAAAPSASSHTCSSSYTHAVLSYGHRCLRRGQFCAMGEQSNYRRLGFRCVGGRLR